uniref:Uncharacterized protein n=1 Tax=Arundo donax TaxID=35708 RepID=A0A0A9GMK1_ARUDO
MRPYIWHSNLNHCQFGIRCNCSFSGPCFLLWPISIRAHACTQQKVSDMIWPGSHDL